MVSNELLGALNLHFIFKSRFNSLNSEDIIDLTNDTVSHCLKEHCSNIPDLIFKTLPSHYENTPMQYSAIFHGCKNDNFQMKNRDILLKT